MTRLYSAGLDVGELGEYRGEGHVDPHVDGAEGLFGLCRRRFDLIRVGDVGRDGQGYAARPFDVADRAGQSRLAPGQQRHLGAAGGEGQGRGPADPAAGPGHHDHLSGHAQCSFAWTSAVLWSAVRACAGHGAGQPLGRFEQQGVHERLRRVAAHLPLQ